MVTRKINNEKKKTSSTVKREYQINSEFIPQTITLSLI